MPIIHQAIAIEALPSPPEEKTGWPWTEESDPLPEKMPDGSEWPRISIVTPSYNQGQFIEETIRSVLLQGYPNLEYIIIDGGSSDNSVEIIKKYEPWLAYWVSEKDRGQSHALNKGFRRATGQWIGWQNSDDYYHSNVFIHAVTITSNHSMIDVVYGNTYYITASGSILNKAPETEVDWNKMLVFIFNQSSFFNARIFRNENFIDESFNHCMDQEFFWRLLVNKYKFVSQSKILSYFRIHQDSKGSKQIKIANEEYLRIYNTLYKLDLDNHQKQKLIKYIRDLCLNFYIRLELEVFRQQVRLFFENYGFSQQDKSLMFRYIFSFLGHKNIVFFRKIKASLTKLRCSVCMTCPKWWGIYSREIKNE